MDLKKDDYVYLKPNRNGWHYKYRIIRFLDDGRIVCQSSSGHHCHVVVGDVVMRTTRQAPNFSKLGGCVNDAQQ
jgi:hypothetical protein